MKILKSILSATLILFSINVISQETIKKIQDRGSIIIGTSGQQNPYSFIDEKVSLIGIDIELANALAEAMGVKLELKKMDFPLLLDALKAGEVDAVISGLSMKVDRNMDFLFAGPYWQTDKAVLTIKNRIKNTGKV